MTESPRAVFLCHASRDAEAADRIRAALEEEGVSCWIAPRDIPPGSTWAGAILQGIRSSELMLILVTEASNASVQVVREVERALHHGRPLLPVRLSPVLPADDLEYFLSAAQWFDAFPGSLAAHAPRLAAAVRTALAGRGAPEAARSEGTSSAWTSAPPSPPPDATGTRARPDLSATSLPSGRFHPRPDTLVFGFLVLLALGVLVWALTMGRTPVTAAKESAASPPSVPAPAAPPKADLPVAVPPAPPSSPADSASPEPSAPATPIVVTNGLGMRLRFVAPQTFRMGSEGASDERNDERAHDVTLRRGCYLGTTEVTVGQFKAFAADATYQTVAERGGGGDYSVGGASYERDAGLTWRTPGFVQTDEHPVVFIAYQDALAFCAWLSRRERATYRLPTEAEWEVACRAGSTADYPWGDDPEGGAGRANVCAPEAGKADRFLFDDSFPQTAPVASFRPNAWGFYDTIGNVMEWCLDWHEPYGADAQVDPTGPASGITRVLRGGAWFSTPRRSRSAHRFRSPEDRRTAGTGFRVALDPP